MEISDILVPIDFSAASLKSLEYALSMVSEDGEIYLLHVIDSDLIDKIQQNEIANSEAVIEKMRSRANQALDEIIGDHPDISNKLHKMIVIGVPFIEILRIANDLDFSLIVMGIRGKQNPIRELFFGSTVDRVLHTTRTPIVCVPL